jgi:hypothetical protein
MEQGLFVTTTTQDEPMPPLESRLPSEQPPGRGRGRARTLDRSRLRAANAAELDAVRTGPELYQPVDIPRPSTRAECREEARPCPWVGCKHHLYLDINPETGSIKINFPDLEPWELQHTCALDVAERGGITLEEVGEIMNLTRERIRQVEVQALLRIKRASPSSEEVGAELLHPGPDAEQQVADRS